MKLIRPYWLLFILLLSQWPAHARNFPKLHFTVDDGLPSNTVYHIYRDSKGFLWFATDKGIARYNGIRFERFTTFNGLPDNEVFFFAEDHEGRLWLATYNGELCYYKDGIFHTAANTPFLKLSRQSSFIRHIDIEPDSSVTMLFFEEDHFVNIYKDQLKDYRTDYLKALNLIVSDTAKYYSVQSMNKLGKSRYRVVRLDDAVDIDVKTGTYHVENRKEPVIGVRMGHNSSYYFTATRLLNNALQPIAMISDEISLAVRKKILYINAIYQNEGYTFLGSNKGLFISSYGSKLVADTPVVLQGSNVSSVEQDGNGNYWVGTLGEGAYYFDKFFHSNYQQQKAYNGSVKYSAVVNGNIFYVNDSGNLYKYTNGTSVCLFNYGVRRGLAKNPFTSEPAFLVNKYNQYFSFLNNENVVVDDVLNVKTAGVKFYPSNLLNSGFKGFFAKGKNAIYGVNLRRVYYVDYSTVSFTKDIAKNIHYIVYEDNNRSRIFCANQDNHDNIWYSTINSVCKVEGDASIPQTQFKEVAFKQFLFLGNYMVGSTHANRLLICSGYDTRSIETTEVPQQECIWDKFYKVSDTSVLISTDNYYRYLVIHPGRKELFSIITVENELIPVRPESVCCDGSYCYFFKDGTITSIAVGYLNKRYAPPTLRFTGLISQHKTYPVTIDNAIPYSEAKNIKIRFSTVSFDSKNVSYQYSISKGDPDNWSDIQTEQINILDPSYGLYTVKVRGKTLSSQFSEPVVFTFRVLRPYWATWWFIALIVCCAGCVILLLVRRRIMVFVKAREREHESKVKFMKSEYKALNALMNPHFIFNTLNNVQSLVNKDDKRAANEYLRIFADLVRQNMHNVSNELIPLEREMNLVSNYLLLEKLRFKENLNYVINCEDLDLSEIMVPPLLIQPLVENSIKHGILPMESSNGVVQVNVYERQNILYIESRDNGVGLSKQRASGQHEGSHQSFGLENIRKRVEQLSIIQNRQISFEITEMYEEEQRWTVARISMSL